MFRRINGFGTEIALAVLIALAPAVGTPFAAQAQTHAPTAGSPARSDVQRFVDGTGKLLYFFAWPTADYEGVDLDGIFGRSGGFDVQVTVYGKSALDGSSLWTEVVLEIRNGQVSNLRWGRNNAILFQPGESMTAWGQALQELSREYARDSAADRSGNTVQAR